jgi:membrane associated rhomboid family serine protease
MISITASIIIITVLVSLAAMNNPKVMNDLAFWPWEMDGRSDQQYRFLTHAFIHAGWMHLIFNMWALYSFGENLERYYFSQPEIFGSKGKLFYLLLYITSIVVSSVPDYFARKNQSGYRAVGASGAVSAVVFASILLNPGIGIGLIFIPIPIPGYIFGVLFIAVSAYLEKRGNSNIAHGAHIYGALYGLLFTLVTTRLFSNYETIQEFVNQIRMRY